MKHQIVRLMAVFGLVLGMAVATAQAQAPSKVEVNIPFEFSAGKTTLKAGVYTIRRLSGNVVTLRNVDDKSSVILNAPVNLSSTDPKATERLVFNKAGDQYALAQIWLTADSGREVLKQKNTQQPERIELSLRVSKHVD